MNEGYSDAVCNHWDAVAIVRASLQAEGHASRPNIILTIPYVLTRSRRISTIRGEGESLTSLLSCK